MQSLMQHEVSAVHGGWQIQPLVGAGIEISTAGLLTWMLVEAAVEDYSLMAISILGIMVSITGDGIYRIYATLSE